MVKRYAFVHVLLIACSALAASPKLHVKVLDKPLTTRRNDFYVSNRPPLTPSALIKLPVGSVKPKLWLLEFLKRQRAGLTGNLGKISAWLQKEDNAWLSKDGKGKWGWEEVPYWLKGYANIGYILSDDQIITEAKVWIDGTLNSQRPDGDFGPDHRHRNGNRDYWANMIMLFCLQSYYEYSNDRRVIDLMTRYFRHQLTVPDDAILSGYWDKMRGGDNLYSIYWLYNRTGDAFLLDLAKKIHRNTANWKLKNTLCNWHNVNIAQAFDEPAIYYQQSHDPTDLQAPYDNFRIIRKLYGQMPGGLFAADENARPGYDDPHQCIETCGIVEHMLSDEQLLAITGDLFWADHCEDVAFNTYPAAVMPDFKSLRYLTGVNQVLSDSENHSPGVQNSGPMFVMNPFSSRCCQHNHSHGWPYYAQHLWFATPDNGLAAVLYCASNVKATVGTGVKVSIEEKTRYPFDDTLQFRISTPRTTRFPLYLRMPGWCKDPKVIINGRPLQISAQPRQYIRLDNRWNDGDTILLKLPMTISVKRWPENHNSASVYRGPLTYSLKIGEKLIKRPSEETAIGDSRWQKGVDKSNWPAWEIHPSTPWNYGLVLDSDQPESSFKVITRDWPQDNMPFTNAAAPIQLIATGKRIPKWQLDENKLAGALFDSPVKSNEPAETITLIPMGAARLRIASFPVIAETQAGKANPD